jgi:hypothetical protein
MSVWSPAGGGACGDMLEAMARISNLEPNEAMARIAPRSQMVPMVNNKNFTRPKLVFFKLYSKLFSKVQMDSKRRLG